MSRRTIVIIGILVAAGLVAAGFIYDRVAAGQQDPAVAQNAGALVRPHSPVIGPADAPVTIVEFFDPSCEGCRAFYPIVKQVMAKYPNDVRLVLRYVLFHKGSEEVVRILEAARKQGVYVPVLDAILAAQPQWHDDPQLQAAWRAASAAGLDEEKAREQMTAPEVTAIIEQDVADTKAVGIAGTPTFYVNGRQLTKLAPQQLDELVRSEVEQAR